MPAADCRRTSINQLDLQGHVAVTGAAFDLPGDRATY